MELRTLFNLHDRRWRNFAYVYPVISRRAKGLSIGVNLNPDAACNFDCVYCQVDRSTKRSLKVVDLAVLESELRHLVTNHRGLFGESEFRSVPERYRRLNDIAFSGDGEPTASPAFPAAVRLAADIRRQCATSETKIVVITNACFLTRPKVAAALALLDENNGEIWGKLDAGTEAYYRRVDRPSHSLQHVLDNLLAAARVRPIVIQSLFMRLNDDAPPAGEITAYADRLSQLVKDGGRISLVQIYTVARQPAEAYVSPLTDRELESIGDAVREVGLPVECYL
jgi:wyosine [tRNA(Phe)-imidazoG37] synthetase (radical SAM superfamily)